MKPRKPIIGITCHAALQSSPGGHRTLFHRLSAQYTLAVREAGGLPMLLGTAAYSVPSPVEAIDGIDGLLLSGGTDLPAGSFGENPRPSLRETDPERYDYEVDLIREARRRGVPLLGICRGHQTLTEALGGTLIRSIALERPESPPHYQELRPDAPSHGISTTAGTRLGEWFGEKAKVNSFHRQAVLTPPPGFIASAHAGDDLIEAIEAREGFVVGIQFHPEWLFAQRPAFLKPFEALVESAGRFSGRPCRSTSTAHLKWEEKS